MHQTVVLPGDGTDFGHWRNVARRMCELGVSPESLVWLTEHGQQRSADLFAQAPSVTQIADLPAAPAQAMTINATKEWVLMAAQSFLNCAPERFALAYRMLWRMQHEPTLKRDPLDPDRVQMQLWVKAVRREIHKMHAFVRFRPVDAPSHVHDGEGPLHVAWFEPVHHVVHAAAPFFVKRFANMRWAILTPQCSLRWWPQASSIDALAAYGVEAAHAIQPLRGRAGVLSWGPGAQAQDAPDADAGEALWLTYYANIFNPARLKIAAMRKEMPRRYWHNLPEAQLISPLIQAAQARSANMLASAPTTPKRRLPKAS